MFNYTNQKKINFNFDYFLIYSDQSEAESEKYFEKTKIKKIYAHHYDFDNYISKSTNKIVQTKYAVFLDEAIFNHPDEFELKYNINHTLAYEYYKNLNHFFDLFEKKTNIKVIIAIHPRSLIYEYKKKYCNRRTIINKTSELVANSKLVFAHYSTSVNYAILYKKPLFFLISKQMVELGYLTKILSYSIETGGKLINYDRKLNDYNFYSHNYNLYNDYKKKFIKTSKSKNYDLWKILYTNMKDN